MRKFVLVLLALGAIGIGIAGCTSLHPSYGIISSGQTDTAERQTIEGMRKYETMVIVPIGSSILSDKDKVGLKVGRIFHNNNLQGYFFRAEAHLSNWAFLNSIKIKIDDTVYTLRDDDPTRQVLSHGDVTETLNFPLTSDIVEKLRNARAFSAELHGRVESVGGSQLQQMKSFLNNVPLGEVKKN